MSIWSLSKMWWKMDKNCFIYSNIHFYYIIDFILRNNANVVHTFLFILLNNLSKHHAKWYFFWVHFVVFKEVTKYSQKILISCSITCNYIILTERVHCHVFNKHSISNLYCKYLTWYFQNEHYQKSN